MHFLSIFDLKFGFYVKFHIYGQFFRSKSPSPGQNLSKSCVCVCVFFPFIFSYMQVNSENEFYATFWFLLEILIWTGAFRPEKLTIYVKIYVESEFQVENDKKMHLEPEN